MKNVVVQERLFTEPKDNPEEALKFVIHSNRARSRKKTTCVKAANIKEEPVFAVKNNNECYKCGEKPFVVGHQKVCKAKGVECRNCGKTGHYARMCRLKTPETKKNNTANRKVNAIRTKSPWSSSEEESAEEVAILHIDGETPKNKPFVLKGKFNRKPFHALIDTGSPITIFTKAHAKKMFGKHYKMKPLDKEDTFIIKLIIIYLFSIIVC